MYYHYMKVFFQPWHNDPKEEDEIRSAWSKKINSCASSPPAL